MVILGDQPHQLVSLHVLCQFINLSIAYSTFPIINIEIFKWHGFYEFWIELTSITLNGLLLQYLVKDGFVLFMLLTKYRQITATLKHIHVLPHTYHTQTNTHTHTHSDHNKQRNNLKNITKKSGCYWSHRESTQARQNREKSQYNKTSGQIMNTAEYVNLNLKMKWFWPYYTKQSYCVKFTCIMTNSIYWIKY